VEIMAERIKKISRDTVIPLGLLFTVVGITIAWSIAYGKQIEKIETHETRITNVEQKLDSIATKDDLDRLEKSLKDFIQK